MLYLQEGSSDTSKRNSLFLKEQESLRFSPLRRATQERGERERDQRQREKRQRGNRGTETAKGTRDNDERAVTRH